MGALNCTLTACAPVDLCAENVDSEVCAGMGILFFIHDGFLPSRRGALNCTHGAIWVSGVEQSKDAQGSVSVSPHAPLLDGLVGGFPPPRRVSSKGIGLSMAQCEAWPRHCPVNDAETLPFPRPTDCIFCASQ